MNKRQDLGRGAIGKPAVIGAVERAGRVTGADQRHQPGRDRQVMTENVRSIARMEAQLRAPDRMSKYDSLREWKLVKTRKAWGCTKPCNRNRLRDQE